MPCSHVGDEYRVSLRQVEKRNEKRETRDERERRKEERVRERQRESTRYRPCFTTSETFIATAAGSNQARRQASNRRIFGESTMTIVRQPASATLYAFNANANANARRMFSYYADPVTAYPYRCSIRI